MNNPRKIVLILGNGFDLDLGLKTSYKDFWESKYCPKDYPAPLIRHLNKRWDEDLEAVRWYDMENELLRYAKEGDKTDVIDEMQRAYLNEHSDYELCLAYGYTGKDEIFSSLLEAGIIRIKNITAFVPFREDLNRSVPWRDHKAFQLIKEGLCKYLKSIWRAEANDSIALNVLSAANIAREEGDNLRVYSFNYTTLPVEHGGGFMDVFHYVHGNCDKGNVIIGTRDEEDFNVEYDFLMKAFDPSFNPPDIVADLLDADEVIVFGHSLGENDRQYFSPFFLRQVDFVGFKKKRITIFTRDDKSRMEINRALQIMTRGNLSALYSLNQLIIIRTAALKEDQRLMYDFLCNLHIDSRWASSIIGRLLE